MLHFLNSKTSIVLAADDSVVSWGPSPTYGELVRNHSLFLVIPMFRSILPFCFCLFIRVGLKNGVWFAIHS